jgi:hypothetical protein
MSKPTDFLFPSDALPAEDDPQAQIADYLDYLCAPLLGIVPYAQRRRLRLETEDHLRALAEDFGAEGFAPDEAVSVALREYGEPWRIGQDFAEAWLTGPHPCRFARFTDAATLRAFGWFGVFSVLTLLGVEQCALAPHQEALSFLVQCLAVFAPFIAGVLTGFALHPKTAGGVCRAMAALALVSGAAGLLVLPHMEVLQFALFQFVFWLPVGCLSAAVTASLRRQLRLQNFRHASRRS